MNEIVKVTSGLTMSSLEISDLVRSRHEDVRRSIERLGEKGIFTLPPMAEVSNPGPGPKFIKVYNLDKRSSLIVVAQLCPEFTATVVDRWQELEEKVGKQVDPVAVLSDPNALRGLLLTYSEKVIALETTVKEQAVDVAALNRIAKGDGSLCITDAAKSLQVMPKDLFRFLQQHDWIYRRLGNADPIAYQDKIRSGYLEHKITTVTRSDGSEKTVTQVRVTPAGLAKLAKLMEPKEPLLV